MKNYEIHAYANFFPMMNDEELQNLKQDIEKNGYDKSLPIILFEDKILDGRNRYKVCKELGIEPAYRQFEGDFALSYVIRTNLNRRHLNQSQKAVIALDILPVYEAEARRRQATGGKGIYGGKPLNLQINGAVNKGRADEQVGQQLGVSRAYVAEAKKIQQTQPQILQEIKQGKKTISEARKERKQEERRQKIDEQRQAIQNGDIKTIDGKFEIIVIDPPWKVDYNYSPDHYMGRVANPYPEMTVHEIKQIELPTADNCILWLWTTHSQIWSAKDIMDAWGFDYKGILVWNKVKMGIGHWLRKQCEFCLLGVKGKPIWDANDVRDIIVEEKTIHSAKPDSFYAMVDKVCVGRKLDYFARKRRAGWEVYGDEIKT